MSMFKVPSRVPANNIVTNDERNFVSKEQIDNINQIPNIQTAITNIVTDAVKELNLVNDVLLITDGKVTLTHQPLSNKVINDMYIITEMLSDGTMLVHLEEVGGFQIVDKVIEMGTGFFNGLELRVSYVIEGSL